MVLQELRNEIATAYADAGPQRDNDHHSNDMRCLSFLTSGWLTPDEAASAVELIGPYNAFDPDTVADMLDTVLENDPDALVAIGREGSPVLYVETDDPEAVVSVFGEWGEGTPDELSEVSPGSVGSARKDLYGDGDEQIDPHITCSHADPPVPVEEYAEPDPDRAHVRAWWD